MSALFMLECDLWPQGLYPVCDGEHYMQVAADFSRPYSKGFRPADGLAARAVPRMSAGHMAVGSYLLNGELLDVVESGHGPATWVVGAALFEDEDGRGEAPCGYGFVGEKLVAMLAPMIRTKGRWS